MNIDIDSKEEITMYSKRVWSGCLSICVIGLTEMSWSADVHQITRGACSPAIADVKGTVNITCNGMDQATVDKVVQLLNEILKDRKKLDQIQVDLDNTSKRTDQIEARQAARRVNQHQSAELIKLLAGKMALPVRVSTPIGNAEALQYARDIGSTLVTAGWQITQPVGTLQIMGSPTGVIIHARNSQAPAAKLLVDSLRTVGIQVKAFDVPDYDPNMIGLIVGGKEL